MKTEYKIAIGVSAALFCFWVLTTKNEVVEGMVYPLKVKLGLAEYKTTDGTVAAGSSKSK